MPDKENKDFKSKKSGDFKSKGKGKKLYPKAGSDRGERSTAVATTYNPLLVDFIPGTEGAGRVAATHKAGLREAGILSGTSGELTVPPVAVVDWAPCVGSLLNPANRSIIGTAEYRFYNTVRSRNASLSAYSPHDIFMAMEAVTGVAVLMGAIRVRLEVLCTAGSQLTSAYPQALMSALGLTTTDRDNLNSYIVRYNQMVLLSQGLIMPKAYKLFARRATLAGTVYLDDPLIAKSQLIIMNPAYHYVWDVDPTSSTVGQLRCESLKLLNLANMLNKAETIIHAYTLDVDINNIFAEMRKAFSENEVYTLLPFPLDGEPLNVKFDQILLDQLHNAVLSGPFVTGHEPHITVNSSTGDLEYVGGQIGCLPVWEQGTATSAFKHGNGGSSTNTGFYYSQYHRVYSHDDQPDEHSTANLCAFKINMGYVSGAVSFNSVDTCGTELIMDVEIFAYEVVPTGYNFVQYDFKGITIVRPSSWGVSSTIYDYLQATRYYLTFGYLPVIDIRYQWVSGSPAYDDGMAFEGDVDNRYPITIVALEQIHNAIIAWLVELSV